MADRRTIERRLAMLLAPHGRTFADELAIPLAGGTPKALFRWLVACILYSVRIDARIATEAAAAMAEVGWTTADALAASDVGDRVAVLDRVHDTRYDERMARLLGEAARHVRDRYDGDLGALRAAAARDPKAELRLLEEISGLGPTGAKIFCREAQAPWDEFYPFCDNKAWGAAKALELARCGLAKDEAGVRAAAQAEAAVGEGE